MASELKDFKELENHLVVKEDELRANFAKKEATYAAIKEDDESEQGKVTFNKPYLLRKSYIDINFRDETAPLAVHR